MDDDLSLLSDTSFDPIALANQRTTYYAKQQQQTKEEHPPKGHPGAYHQTLIGSPEAPSRGSKKSSDGFISSPKRTDAMLSPSTTKSRPSSSKSSGIPAIGVPISTDDPTIIAHEVVPLGADDETNVRELNANINHVTIDRIAQENRALQAQLQAQNEADRIRMIQENDRLQQEMRETAQREKEVREAEKAAKREKQRRYMKILLFFVVVAAIGLGAYFGTRSSSSSSPPSGSAINPNPTQAPATPNGNSVYEPPNPEDCDTMEKGLPRANDYQGLLYRQFDLILNTQVSSDVSSSSTISANLLSVLKQQIERLLRPRIVGCPTARRRGLYVTGKRRNSRELNELQYLIYDLEVSLAQDTESTCTVNNPSSGPCHVLVTSMDVWLQGDQPDLLVRGYVYELLNTLNLPETLELESQFDLIVVKDVRDPSNFTPIDGSPSANPFPDPTASPGSCDLSSNFKNGFYYEHNGGIDQIHVVDCSIFQGTRAIALAVDESTCNFSCVGRKEPQAFGPYCARQPAGTTIQLLVNGDNTGSKIYLGTESDSRFLDCNPPLTIVE